MSSPPELACAVCGRVAQRIKRLPGGGGLCRHCYNEARKEPCSRCGKVRAPTNRTATGAPLCATCARPKRECAGCGRVQQVAQIVDGSFYCRGCYHAPERVCGGCGLLRPIAARAQNGLTDLCRRCYRTRNAACGICGNSRDIHVNWPLGPVCFGCYRQALRTPRRCPGCGQARALIGRSATGPQICGPCAGSDRDYLCANCGQAGEQHFANLCKRCSIRVAVERLLAATTGNVPDALVGLPAALANHGRPESTMRWLDRPRPRALLRALGDGAPVTHGSVDDLPPGQARHHLRSLLIAARVLPPRDEHADRLETWIDEYLAELPRRHALLIRPYARWMVLRLVRRRAQRRRTTTGTARSAQERIRSAHRLLRHLDDRGEQITDLTQATIDVWLGGNRTRTANIGPFIRWLNRRGITPDLDVVTPKRPRPTLVHSDEQHHAQIHHLLSSSAAEVELSLRVAGLFVLLYGARIERIHRLTTADITRPDGRLHVALSDHLTEIPTELVTLIEQLVTTAKESPRGRTLDGDDYFLFPSTRQPHVPTNPGTLGRKLSRIGIHNPVARNTAMAALAADLPAAIVATQFGLTPQTTARWAQHSRRNGVEYLVARSAREPGGRPPTTAQGVRDCPL